MDRKRLIGKILMHNGWAIQSKGYSQFYPIGRPEILTQFYDEWQVDEILLVEKSHSSESKKSMVEVIRRVVDHCRTPLTVCGGIDDVSTALQFVENGADRVAVNAGFLHNPELANQLKDVLGRQAVVAYVDFINIEDKFWVYDYQTRNKTELPVQDYCQRLIDEGVGEILLHSVNRDGSKKGYEVPFYQDISQQLSVPIIASGGYGKPEHIEALMASNVGAFSIGNSLAFTEHAASQIKGYLRSDEIRRSHIHYNRSQIDETGRLLKKDDDDLDDMRFKKRNAIWM